MTEELPHVEYYISWTKDGENRITERPVNFRSDREAEEYVQWLYEDTGIVHNLVVFGDLDEVYVQDNLLEPFGGV